MRIMFFPKNTQKTPPIIKRNTKESISDTLTRSIFPKRKLNISSCTFPSIPTKNIPDASPICHSISLVDSREVVEYFSKSSNSRTPKNAKTTPYT